MNTRRFVARRRFGLLLVPLALWLGGCEGEKSAPQGTASAPSAGPVLPAVDAAATWRTPSVDVSALPDKIGEAIKAAGAAVRSAPDNARQVGSLGALYYAHDFPDSAASCFGRAAHLDPERLAWWFALARASERAGAADQAIAAYDRMLAREGEDIAAGKLEAPYLPARIRLAVLLMDRDRQRATTLFNEVAEAAPYDPAAHCGLAECARAAGRAEEAEQHFRRAVKYAPNYGAARAGLAALLEARGHGEEAARHRRHVRTETRILPTVDPLETSLLRQGLHLNSLVRHARALVERREFAKAMELLQAAMAIDEGGAMARTAVGQVLSVQGEVERAMHEFRRVLQAQPDYAAAKMNLAYVLGQRGEYAEAEQLLQAVLEQQPDEVRALERLCVLAARQEQPDKALPWIERTQAAAGEDPALHTWVGKLLRELDRNEDARAALQRALELDPEHAPAHYQLGLLAYTEDDPAGARRACTEALRLAPGFFPARRALFAVLKDEKDFDAAEKCLREGLEYQSASADLNNTLAWLLATSPDASRRKPTEAVTLAEKACKLSNYGEPTMLDTLAAAYAAAGRFEDAAGWAAEAARLTRDHGHDEDAEKYLARRDLYEARRPYVDEELGTD